MKWPFSNPEILSNLYRQIINKNEQDKRMDVDREDLSREEKKAGGLQKGDRVIEE